MLISIDGYYRLHNTVLLCSNLDAQMCIMGFPTIVPDCSGSNCDTKRGTFIVPDMRFTCSGTVTGWRVAGEHFGGNTNSKLIILRERSIEPGTYDTVDTIELGDCAGQSVETGMNNVYECTLNRRRRVSVQPGDIIGIETPGQANGKFRLYFDSSGGPTNYILDSRAPQTINLSDSNLLIDQLVPQISLTVTASTTQITTTEMTDGSTTTSEPTSTEAESIATSDPTEMTDGGTTTSGLISTEARSSDRTTEMTDGSTTTSGSTSTEAESIATSDHTTEMTDGGSITSGPSSTEAATSDHTTDGSTITSGSSSTEARSIATSVHTTEMTDGGTFTSGSSSTEARSIATSGRTTEMTDGGTTTSGPSSTEARSSDHTTVNIELTDGSTSTSGLTSTEAATSDHTTVQIIDFTTTSSPRLGDSANNPDKDNSDTSIAIVGAVVGVLLVFISILLLILILRRQRSGQKLLPASNNNNVINPVYNGKQSLTSIIII